MATFTLPQIAMTNYSLLHAPYVISASKYSGSSYPYNAFDKNTDTEWSTGASSTSEWIKIDFGKPYIVSGYNYNGKKSSAGTAESVSISIYGSLNDTDWTLLHSQTIASGASSAIQYSANFANPTICRYMRCDISNNTNSPKTVIELTYICSLPDNYGTNVEYYISQQTGDDNNDGLTPQTAWKTIDKAISTVLPVQDSSVVVYIAPGTYRESIVFNGSINDNEKIIFKGDPDCLHFPDCISGPVRISGYQEDEQTPIESITPTNPFLVFCDGKVVFDTIEFYCPINGLIGDSFINCKVWSCLVGVSLFTFAKNCEVYSNHIGFNGLSTSVSSAYNCICFSNRSCFNLSSCYHCFGIGLIAFNSCVSYNCAAQYSPTGFSDGSCYNCIASNCQNGFTSTSGSNRKSIGCDANTGDSPGSAFYFLPEIKTIIKNGIVDKGIPIVDNPTDLLGLERAGGDGNIDIGPIESCDYSLEYNDYYLSAPAVRINRKGQLSFKFRINAGDRVIKQVTVKHVNTSEDLKPQVIIRGLGINLIQTASYDNNMWETLTLSFTAPVSGVMEVILYARDSNEDSYSLFANFI